MPARWNDPHAPARRAQLDLSLAANIVIWTIYVLLIVTAVIVTWAP